MSTSGELREPLPLTPQALVETGGNGVWHHFPCLWERLPHLGWEGGQVRGEKWPKILAPSCLVFFHPHRLLAVGCSLGESVLFESTHDHWEDILSQRNTGMSKRRRKQGVGVGVGGQKPLCHSVLQRTLNDGPGEALDTVLRDWHHPGFVLGPLVPHRSPSRELLCEGCRWSLLRRKGGGLSRQVVSISGLRCVAWLSCPIGSVGVVPGAINAAWGGDPRVCWLCLTQNSSCLDLGMCVGH